MKEWLSKLTKEEKLTIVGVFLTIFGSYIGYCGVEKRIRVFVSAIISFIGGVILLVQDIKYYKQGLYNEKQKRILITLAILGLIVICREDSLYLSLVIAANFIHKDLKKLIKIIFYSSIISYGMLVILYLIKVIPANDIQRVLLGLNINKKSLGFSHPNVACRFFLGIVLIGMFIFKDKLIYGLSALLLGIIMFYITGSRAGLVAAIALAIVCLIPKKITTKIFKLKYIPYLFLIFTFISVAGAFLFHQGELNGISSNRFNLWYGYLKEIGVFAKIERVGSGPLDNMFINTMYYGGMYGYIYYLAIYLLAFSKIKKNNELLFSLILTTFICGFFENFTSYGENKILLIMLVVALDENKLDDLEEKNIEKAYQ